MKFAYKVYSGYDGFTPARLPERMDGPRLRLGWRRYIDSVEEGDEIWVYFHGPHAFTSGVYVKGIAEDIDYLDNVVWLRVTEQSRTTPITADRDSRRLSQVVAARGRQVFFLPDELHVISSCSLSTTASTCRARQCGSCGTWASFIGVDRRTLRFPRRLIGTVDDYAPGFWVIPSRSFLYRGGPIRRGVTQTSNLFYRFKAGDDSVTYPLALGMHKALARAHRLDFDLVLPVPLSPDKMASGELHRTKVLAEELARLLDGPRVDASGLSLTSPISKRKLRTQGGYTARQFEDAYGQTLQVDERVRLARRVLLVDDVCTEGSTLRTCARAVRAGNPDCEMVAVTAGQMAVRQAVRDSSALTEREA